MADFGLTAQGFKRKTYPDILESMQARARAFFGEDVNLSDRSPLGLFLQVIAWDQAQIWEEIEKVYHAQHVDSAEGAQLDGVAKRISLTRRPAEKATGTLTITGTADTAITAGTLRVGTKTGIEFDLAEDVTIQETGTVDAAIIAVLAGKSGNVQPGTITEIVTPLAGVESVTNADATAGGRDIETDYEFYNRYLLSLSSAGASTIDSIRAALLNVPGVRAANVVENMTNEVDDEGRPPKSIQCYVLGGEAQDVAKAIFDTKAGGIETVGDVSVTVKDASGQEHIVKFSYATVVPIYVKLTITRNLKYQSDGDARVRTEVIRYIGGEDADGTVHVGLGMRQAVVYTKIIEKAYRIEGIDDIDLELSTDGINWVRTNIDIQSNQVAETTHDKVVITHA